MFTSKQSANWASMDGTTNFKVKNTFIDGLDEDEEYSRVRRTGRQEFCTWCVNIPDGEVVDDPQTPEPDCVLQRNGGNAISSLIMKEHGAQPDIITANTSSTGSPVSDVPNSAQASQLLDTKVSVKNTFIDVELSDTDSTPVAMHRRYPTCPLDFGTYAPEKPEFAAVTQAASSMVTKQARPAEEIVPFHALGDFVPSRKGNRRMIDCNTEDLQELFLAGFPDDFKMPSNRHPYVTKEDPEPDAAEAAATDEHDLEQAGGCTPSSQSMHTPQRNTSDTTGAALRSTWPPRGGSNSAGPKFACPRGKLADVADCELEGTSSTNLAAVPFSCITATMAGDVRPTFNFTTAQHPVVTAVLQPLTSSAASGSVGMATPASLLGSATAAGTLQTASLPWPCPAVTPPWLWNECVPQPIPQIPGLGLRDIITAPTSWSEHMVTAQYGTAALALCHGVPDLPSTVERKAMPPVPVELQAILSKMSLSANTHPEELGNIPKSSKPSRRPLRSWIHIYLHMQTGGFDLVPRLIGRKGCNLRKIADMTGAKIRIRGRGSGHLEGDSRHEAPVPLMVAVTADQQDGSGFNRAVEMTLLELRNTAEKYQQFCAKQGYVCKGPYYSIGMLNEYSKQLLGSTLDNIPQTGPM